MKMVKEKIFEGYHEAQEYFDSIPDKAKVLMVHMGSVQEPDWIKPIAFYKPYMTLEEQKNWRDESPVNDDASTNASFVPENKKLLGILQDSKLLEKIDVELDKKIVGEHEARKTIFMVANMRNVENLNKATDNLMVNAQSGTGKDHLCEALFELIPEQEKEELIRTTPKVLAYTRNRKITPETTWKKTALRLEDASNEVLNDDSFKVFSSANPNKINKGKIVNRGKIIKI